MTSTVPASMGEPLSEADRLAEIRARLDDLSNTRSTARIATTITKAQVGLLHKGPADLQFLLSRVGVLEGQLATAREEADDMRAALERRLLQVRSLRSGGPRKVNPLLCTTPVTTIDEEIEDARVWWQGFDRDQVVRALGLDGGGSDAE